MWLFLGLLTAWAFSNRDRSSAPVKPDIMAELRWAGEWKTPALSSKLSSCIRGKIAQHPDLREYVKTVSIGRS